MRCSYCFVSPHHKPNCVIMSFDIAQKGIDYWIKKIGKFKNGERYNIIFYGGEPLLNRIVFEQCLAYIKTLQKRHKLPKKNLNIFIASNGILINEHIARLLKMHSVSVAIGLDGYGGINDSYRFDKNNNGTFKKILNSFQILRTYKVPVSVSMIITPDVLTSLKINQFLDLLKKFKIRGVGLNLLRERYIKTIFKSDQEKRNYWQQVPKFAIRFWNAAKKTGIKEYKIDHKLQRYKDKNNSMWIDCGGFGDHIAVHPDGIVSACSWSPKYIIDNLQIRKLKRFNFKKEYKHLIPEYNKKCIKCEAISICGGGCPWNKTTIDKNICLFAKTIFKYFSNNKL